MPPNTRRYFEELGTQLKARSPEEYGKIEFEALMRSKLGDRFKGLANQNKIGLMALIGDPTAEYSVSGKNFYYGLDNEQATKGMAENLSAALDEKGLPAGKRIFGIGRSADPGTFAHELRHEQIFNERGNRALDLIYSSTSLPAYKGNIEQIYGYLTNFDYRKANAPLNEKERFVLEELKPILKQEPELAEIGPNRILSEEWLEENIRLNKAGAVGGTMKGKKAQFDLPDSILQYRAKMPFLNFVGRLEDKKPVKKSTGGNVEKVSYDRKLI
jgi:hypothetical protein